MYEQQRHHDNATRTTVAEVIGQIAVGAIVGLVFAWVLINWISGCGEIIYTATGAMQGECIFMPWVNS